MKQSGNPRTQGKRSKTRYKFKKHGAKVSVNDVMREFAIGDTVQIVADGSWHSGLPDKNFHGLSGVVKKKRGEGYEIAVSKGNQPLTCVTTAVHMKKLK